MINWYVLHVLTGRELDVKNKLIKEGFPSLVPRRRLREIKHGRWKEVERILLPGYVFAQAEMIPQEYYRISEAPGVIGILRGASDRPEPVHESEMHLMFRLTQQSDLVGISDIFMDGQNVKVVAGPLVGFEGYIRKVDKRRFRAKVVFTLVGLEKEVELGVNMLDKIESQ